MRIDLQLARSCTRLTVDSLLFRRSSTVCGSRQFVLISLSCIPLSVSVFERPFSVSLFVRQCMNAVISFELVFLSFFFLSLCLNLPLVIYTPLLQYTYYKNSKVRPSVNSNPLAHTSRIYTKTDRRRPTLESVHDGDDALLLLFAFVSLLFVRRTVVRARYPRM